MIFLNYVSPHTHTASNAWHRFHV